MPVMCLGVVVRCRRLFSRRLTYVEAPQDRCVAASVPHHRRWGTLRPPIPQLPRRPCSAPTRAPCARAHRHTELRHPQSTRRPSRPAMRPDIRLRGLGRWDPGGRAATLQAVRRSRPLRQSEWFSRCCSRLRGTAVHCRHRCTTYRSVHTFRVGCHLRVVYSG